MCSSTNEECFFSLSFLNKGWRCNNLIRFESFFSLPYLATELFAATCESGVIESHELNCKWGKINQYVCSFVFNHVWQTLSLPPCSCSQEEPTYSALWGDNKAFDEVIISPAMLNEHMPHMVMEGLNKVCFMRVHGFDGCGCFWNAGEMVFKSCPWFPPLDNWIWWMTSICETSLSIKIQMHSQIFFNDCS